MTMVIVSVRPSRERASSLKAEAGASLLDAPPECDTRVADSDDWW